MKHALRQSSNPRNPMGSDKATGEKKRKHHVRKNRNVKQKREHQIQVGKWANRWGESGKKKKARVSTPKAQVTPEISPNPSSGGALSCALKSECAEEEHQTPRQLAKKAESKGMPRKEGSRVLSCIVRLYKLVSCHRKIAPRRKEKRKVVTSSKSYFWSKKKVKRRSEIV